MIEIPFLILYYWEFSQFYDWPEGEEKEEYDATAGGGGETSIPKAFKFPRKINQ
jgi:hypothetical protein